MVPTGEVMQSFDEHSALRDWRPRVPPLHASEPPTPGMPRPDPHPHPPSIDPSDPLRPIIPSIDEPEPDDPDNDRPEPNPDEIGPAKRLFASFG